MAKNIEADNYTATMSHLEHALKYNHDTAKYHEEGNYEKAHKCSIFALAHCSIARELMKEDEKVHSKT